MLIALLHVCNKRVITSRRWMGRACISPVVFVVMQIEHIAKELHSFG